MKEGTTKVPSEVRLIRLELTRPKAPDPKSGVSTNSTTSAELGAKVRHFPETTK